MRRAADRAAALAALPAVDLVCVLDEESPLAMIMALKPDLLVKGSDHAEADIVGADKMPGLGRNSSACGTASDFRAWQWQGSFQRR